MPLLVTFWGTRGSIPTPGQGTRKFGGNTSCVEIRADETLFICDGGTGLRELGVDLLQRGDDPIEGHFLFSHAHWDHIQGFPFFTPFYDERNVFRVYGKDDDDDRYYRLLSGQMKSEYFPVEFQDLSAQIMPDSLKGGSREIEGVEVSLTEQVHPGGSFAYRLRFNGRTVVYATDHELDLSIEEESDDPDALRKLPAAFVDFCHGADLLIVDAQYTDEEYRTKAGWGHPRATTATDLAIQAEVSQVALYHHDPMHTDREVELITEGCRQRVERLGGKPKVFAAREGLQLQMGD